MTDSARTLTPSRLATLLAATITARLPVLVTGAPGIGKSDVVAQAATAAGADIMISHPAVADPTDFRGLPWPNADKGEATFLPFGDFARALRAERPLVWLMDDIGQAPPSVQAAAMQLLLARQVNNHKLPALVTFIAATNRRTDRAGVSGILTPVLSRFATVVELTPSLDDWCDWAFANNIDDGLIAFLRFRPDLLTAFDPARAADMEPFPCPRTWARAGDLLRLRLPADIRLPALAGAVGEGAAGELVAFLRQREKMPSLDGILLDPDTAPIPTDAPILYAVSAGLAARASAQNLGAVGRYLGRINDAGHAEFAALTLRDAYRRDRKLAATAEFARLAASPLGRLLTGQEG